MEYEKHIKRLVLGYLKNECKSAYKVFLKYNYQNQQKHIATRVAGQTLEDILKVYSRIHEIIQGRLEDTNYFKENSAEFTSPIYLADQLLYLLERNGCYTPVSTPCPRSPGESSVGEIHLHENENVIHHISDVETTPEHSLPGNMPSHSEFSEHMFQTRTPFRRKSISPTFKTPNIDKFPQYMSKTLLQINEFPEKLANTINSALYTPELPKAVNKAAVESSHDNMAAELDVSIKEALKRAEDDPILEEALQDFLCTPMDTLGKDSGAVLTSNDAQPCDSSQTKNWQCVEDQTNNKLSYASNTHTPAKQIETGTANNTSALQNTELNNSKCLNTNQVQYCSTGMVMVPQANQNFQSATTQQYFFVTPPVITQVAQVVQPVTQPAAILQNQCNTVQKGNIMLTEQDLMTIPTIMINDKNEITYSDPLTLTSTTPLKQNEAKNIKEYLTFYGASEQSPIIAPQKKHPKRTKPSLKPTPTIKIEYYQRNRPLEIETIDVERANGNSEQLPALNDMSGDEKETNTNTDEVGTNSVDEQSRRSLPPVCTPSPLVIAARKPTPKSGSHVRNLQFPSPLHRASTEKPDGMQEQSPSLINKQQAAKDLFNDKEEKTDTTENEQSAPNPIVDASDGIDKNDAPIKKEAPIVCWDFNLRKMIAPVIENEKSNLITELARKKTLKKASKRVDLDITESDGKKLEEALKTPVKEVKQARKTPTKKKKKKKIDMSDVEVKTTEDAPKAETKCETKVLSPSKLNANKRNILSNDMEEVTPNIVKDQVQYPVGSKTKRNITSLLETPIKEVKPYTPGTTPDKTLSPFTPMLKANLKGITDGETFAIDTPNFPVTPGFTSMVSNVGAYYMPNDNESDKATKAIVTSEEKKSSVRVVEDDEGREQVYGSKETLESFNKSRAGKKNLELLDRGGIVWDGSSEKDEKSEDEISGDESNNTVIPNLKKSGAQKNSEKVKKDESVKSKDGLKSGVFIDKVPSEEGNELHRSGVDMGILPTGGNDGDQKVEMKMKEDKKPKSNSSSDSEIVDKKIYEKNRNSRDRGSTELQSVPGSKDNVPEKEDNADVPKIAFHHESPTKQIEEIRQTISSISPRSSQSIVSNIHSVKQQLEDKRNRMIQSEKAKQKKTSSRRNASKPSPNVNVQRNKRKPESLKRVVRNCDTSPNPKTKKARKNSDIKPDHKEEDDIDSQDEFFKRSGTNLHRTNTPQKNDGQETAVQEKVTVKKENARSKRANEHAQKSLDPKLLASRYSLRIKNQAQKKPDCQECSPKNSPKKQESKLTDHDQKSCARHGETTDTNKKDSLTNNNRTESVTDESSEKMLSYMSSESDSFDICIFYQEDAVYVYKESDTSGKRFEDYDLKIVDKKFINTVYCEGEDANIVLTVSPFDTLLEMAPTTVGICTVGRETGKDQVDSTVGMSNVPEVASDLENSTEKDDQKSSKKRKNRSDSCSSSSSRKKSKPQVPMNASILSDNNISKLLTKIHGPS